MKTVSFRLTPICFAAISVHAAFSPKKTGKFSAALKFFNISFFNYGLSDMLKFPCRKRLWHVLKRGPV